MNHYTQLAIRELEAFVFGQCPNPVRLPGGLVIGGGTVYPELNFTLPPLQISSDTMPEVRDQYLHMIDDACARAVALHVPGLVVEFELLPELTLCPEWGADIVAILRHALDRYAAQDGLKSGLRVTPNDIREFVRPPILRTGNKWENMVDSFELCAQAGADMLSVESTGGKEVHDDALLNGDLPAAVFALGVLASRDMAFLWDEIVGIANRFGVIPAGDTACGFGNTAMMLAETRHIPRVWAAVIRVMTVARSLVAYERGAVGPSKDCAYEGPYIKAITGCPIALEGAEAACAHGSPVGNIAKATADLWSNESVQNIKLLGGMAPTVSVEQLIYATRLMNVATAQGHDKALLRRNWFVESDSAFDPQAYILRPDVVLALAQDIVEESTPYQRTRRAAHSALETLRKANAAGLLRLPRPELSWLSRLSRQADQLPDSEDVFIEDVIKSQTIDTNKVRLDQYAISIRV
jgi:methanol--5-hydroxybenzimidazolylcobamide Co-methyltransferase